MRDEHGHSTAVAELLLEPWLAGRLAIVNGFGTGVADDKLVHAYVEDMIRFYLGEQPLVRSVETLDLNDPVALEEVLNDLGDHVVKPRHGHGGQDVVVCAHAEDEDVRRVGAQLRRPGAVYSLSGSPELSNNSF
ncbi:MAG: circularly permuted type 2 ATP-grasp protein [Solirubrobacteraceae bacterium]